MRMSANATCIFNILLTSVLALVSLIVLATGITTYAQLSIVNSVEVTSTTPDPDLNNNEDSTTDPLGDPITDIYVIEDVELTNNNTQGIITLEVGNNTEISAPDVLLNYTLDDSFTVTSITIDGVEQTNIDLSAIDLGELEESEINTIIIEVDVTPEEDGSIIYSSQAVVSTPDDEVTLDNNQDQSSLTIEPPVVDVSISKSNEGFSLNTNRVPYTVIIENLSDTLAEDIIVEDTLDYDGGVQYQNLSSTLEPANENISSNSFVLEFEELGPGEIIEITYDLFIQSPVTDTLNNTVEVSTSSNEENLSNNNDQSSTEVITIATVTVTTPRTGAIGAVSIALLTFAGSATVAVAYYNKKRLSH